VTYEVTNCDSLMRITRDNNCDLYDESIHCNGLYLATVQYVQSSIKKYRQRCIKIIITTIVVVIIIILIIIITTTTATIIIIIIIIVIIIMKLFTN